MRKLLLILILFRFVQLSLFAQAPVAAPGPTDEKPVIESVDITGVAEGRVTQDLRTRMQELVGARFDQLAVDEVAFDIQNALHDRVAAIRQFAGSQPDRIKLVFEIGNVNLDRERERNVNSRYIVEEVELRGVPESAISSQLRDDMHKLAGQKLDEEQASDIQNRLRRELSPAKIVSRKVIRGEDRNHVRLLYEVEKAPLFRFKELGTYLVGHSKQSVSFGVEVPIQTRNNRLAIGVVNDGDELLERFAGYRVRFENIKAGTERAGFRLDYYNYHEKWKVATESAVPPASPAGIYRERRGFEPTLTFAFDPRLRVTVGAAATELQMQYPEIHFLNANAGVANLIFEDRWEGSGSQRHYLSANYLVRAATRKLDSDFLYTRHLGEIEYSLRSRRNSFVAKGMVGVISGTAPLFERFSLGNTSTLRGWNKYDLAPLGGNRVAHGSLEYRFTELQVYYDTGSVWDKGNSHETSHSFGFGVHSRANDGNWFFSMGVPIRSGRIQPLKPVFMFGGHF